jgi:hypothetical protein
MIRNVDDFSSDLSINYIGAEKQSEAENWHDRHLHVVFRNHPPKHGLAQSGRSVSPGGISIVN